MGTERDTKPLSQDEVQQILSLVGTLENSGFTYLRLEKGDLKLILSKEGIAEVHPELNSITVAAQTPTATMTVAPAPTASPAPAAPAETGAMAPVEPEQGAVPIPAPMVGRFYAAPEPGAPPFTAVGAHVDEDTTVGLIEVMKVFNAVRAKARGVITRVCVQNGDFIEYGQTLFWVQPHGETGINA